MSSAGLRSPRLLTLASIAAFMAGALPALYFWLTAEWGGTSEIDGMALMGGAIMSWATLIVCSSVGLALALVARRRGASGLVWRLATGANIGGVVGPLCLLLFVLSG